MSEVGLATVHGRRIVVMFVVEGFGEHLVWGTAVVRDGELHLNSKATDVLVPLPGGVERLRPAENLSFAEGAEYMTLVRVDVLPDDRSGADGVSLGLNFGTEA